jgi:hypothetical protein
MAKTNLHVKKDSVKFFKSRGSILITVKRVRDQHADFPHPSPFSIQYIFKFITVLRMLPERSGGSCPSEAHSGGWEGLGKDGQEPMMRGYRGFSITFWFDKNFKLR